MYIVPMLIIVVIQTLNLLQSLQIRVDFMIPKIKKAGGIKVANLFSFFSEWSLFSFFSEWSLWQLSLNIANLNASIY